jgi:predicted transcriptional regulator
MNPYVDLVKILGNMAWLPGTLAHVLNKTEEEVQIMLDILVAQGIVVCCGDKYEITNNGEEWLNRQIESRIFNTHCGNIH